MFSLITLIILNSANLCITSTFDQALIFSSQRIRYQVDEHLNLIDVESIENVQDPYDS